MTVVERFVQVQGWTTNRKVTLVATFTATVAAVNFGVGRVLLPGEGWVDMTFWNTMSALFVGHAVLMAVVAWRVDRSGAEGDWTFYALAIPYAVLLAIFLWALGPLSNGFIVLAPMSALLVMALFDQRKGVFASVVLGAVMLGAVILTIGDWFTYAPALEPQAPDLHTSHHVAAAVGWGVTFATIGNLALSWVLSAASRTATSRLQEAHRLVARYVPREVAQDILEGRLSDADGHHRRKLTVFFSDLVGFSDVAEELEPEDLASVVNDYFGEMTAIAHRHHGTVDELQGDALLILFGAPHATTDREHALNAVRMASEMHQAMAALNQRWRKAGITETLSVRMGINTGVVTVGNFGTATRMKYAALGKHVNIAARLQAIAEPGSTVISYATYLLVEDEVDCRALGGQRLKGIAKPVEAFVVS